MGEFKAGVWFVALVLYFAVFLFIATAVTQTANHYGLDHGIDVADPGFTDITTQYGNINATVDPAAQNDAVSIKDAVTFMATFDGELGLPTTIKWILVTFLFWIPLFMLTYSLYMILPFIH